MQFPEESTDAASSFYRHIIPRERASARSLRIAVHDTDFFGRKCEAVQKFPAPSVLRKAGRPADSPKRGNNWRAMLSRAANIHFPTVTAQLGGNPAAAAAARSGGKVALNKRGREGDKKTDGREPEPKGVDARGGS